MSTTTTGAYVDQTTHELLLPKFNENKNYKKEILKEIIAAICAMLNTNGGTVVINIDADGDDISLSQMSSVVRIVEQHLIAIISTSIASHINFKEDKETVSILVKKADSLITVDYHICLPSQTQVIQIPPSEPKEKVNDIINRNAVDEPVELGSHKKTFFKNKECGLSETKTVQLKNLKAGSSKRTTLADRIIGKSNKFDCYVPAFSNYNGGHIYYGIDDDGMVEGEFIPNEVDKTEIIQKVRKSIKKMIWPEIPKRRVHWEIFFEPVLDENSAPIPLTFVIVIYIAPCLGGVFSEEPECYEIVKGKVVKMLSTTWKKRISKPIELVSLPVPDSTMKRATWGSSKTQKICSSADEQLLAIIHHGKPIKAISNNLVKRHPDIIELQLVILAKKVMASYRTCSFRKAKKLLDEYGMLLKKATEFSMFNAIHIYLKAAICFTQEDVEGVNNILPEVLRQAEIITPGRISAALYLLAALNHLQQKGDDDNVAATFSNKALEHLRQVQDLHKVRADMEQKAHISLAMVYLHCNRFGVPTKKGIDSEYLEKANCSIKAVHQSVYDGNPMYPYREAQFILLQSILFYGKSQVQPDRKRFLEAAFETSKKAETLATACHFHDIQNWCRNCKALFTEDLVRTHTQAPST